MKKVKIVFLGSRPLGLNTIKILEKIEQVEIVGCITKKKSDTAWWDLDPHEHCDKKYRSLSLDELKYIDFDFGISINYWQIIPEEIINKPSLGFINLHHSYNLSFRGRDMNTHAILNARKNNSWYHGTTLHYTDDGLDTGPIIASSYCSIEEEDTAWSLFEKVEVLGNKLLEFWLPKLIQTKPPVSSPTDKHPLNFRKDISKELTLPQEDALDIWDHVRAYDFNNYYEPAYIINNDTEKVYLTTRKEFGSSVYLNITDSKIIYINKKYIK